MSLGFFIANGKSSKDFNVYLTDAAAYGIAEKDSEVVSIKGRSGDLILDNKRYKNKKFSYPAIINEDFDKNFSALMNYLLSQQGYIKLEDSFSPEVFVWARYVGETNPKKTISDAKTGKFELTFDRKPQRYLKQGEYPLEITSNTTINSNNIQTALPIIRAYGTGTFSIGGVAVQITSANGYTDIDCEMQEAYKDTLATNCNGNIVLVNGKFPGINYGDNAITLSGITKLEIKPRWWTL